MAGIRESGRLSAKGSDQRYILEQSFESLSDLIDKIVKSDTENRLLLRNASCEPSTILRVLHTLSYSVFINTHGLSAISILMLVLDFKLD